MYEQEKINPYRQGEKGAQVEEMFDNIAPTYDTLNHRLSWDIDKGWRKKAIKQLAPFRPQKMLDIATGTGDFAILSAQMLHPLQLIGTDISEGMMKIGKEKVKAYYKKDHTHTSLKGAQHNAKCVAKGLKKMKSPLAKYLK